MHSRILSLRTVNDKSILCFDLTLNIVKETVSHIDILINGRNYTLEKRAWVNTLKIWDDGKTFFIVCSKKTDSDYAMKVLLKYSISLIDKRMSNLSQFKDRLLNELAA